MAVVTKPALRRGAWMVGWNPADTGRPAVAVGQHPDRTNWSSPYACTSGGCYSAFRAMSDRDKEIALVGLAFQIVADGVDVTDVLREFALLPEWRDMGLLLPQGHVQRALLGGKWSPHNP